MLRFVFDEDLFLKKMTTIAKRFSLKLSYTKSNSWYDDEKFQYEALLTGKYNFELSFHDDMILITPSSLNIHNCYNFGFLDDAFSNRKARKFTYNDQASEYTVFSSDIKFDDLSDDEIFNIVEKIIEALYGARSMKYETLKADDGKKSFIFYLDAPDYYGYTETTEIGNFKFILNKENGGN